MTITKGALVTSAFDELRMNGMTVDPSAPAIASAIRRMDLMVDSWKSYNICLNYVDSEEGNEDPTQESGIDNNNALAVSINLAVQLSSMYGKQLTMGTLSQAKRLYDGLFNPHVEQREASPYQPLGSGNGVGLRFVGAYDCGDFQPYEKNAPQNCDTYNIKTGQTKTYTLDYSEYVPDGEEILSYEYSTDGGITISSISEADSVFTVVIEAGYVKASSMKITITLTPSLDVNPITTFFNVIES